MQYKLTPLFCKPPNDQERQTVLYAKYSELLNSTIQFRALNLQTDLPIIHDWVNQDYAHEYWQMNGHFSQLFAIYQCMELNPYSHSFIGYLNGNIICQFDVYSVLADELKDHVAAESTDCGFHLLMAPNKNPIPGLTDVLIKFFLNHYFSFPRAKRMYAEPDTGNLKSIELLEHCGFKKIKTIQMSYKKAHVYCLERPSG